MKTIFLLLSILICTLPYINAQETSVFDFNSTIETKKRDKLSESPYALFGDNTAVLKTEHEKNLDHSLKIPLLEDDKQIGLFDLNFQTSIVTIKDENGFLIAKQKLTQEQLTRFLSIDPHAENYYSWSPYVYVMNNPMKYIDPDGMDIYIMTSDGRIVLALKNDNKQDKLYAQKTNSEGGAYTDIGGGIIINDKGLLPQLANAPNSTYKGHYAETSNASDAFSIFKFASDNSKVEWGLKGYKTEGKDGFLIMTSHNAKRVYDTNGSFSEFYNIFDIHSHPNTTEQGASDTDRSYAYGREQKNKRYNQAYPDLINPNFYVYNTALKEIYKYTPHNPQRKTINNINSPFKIRRAIYK